VQLLGVLRDVLDAGTQVGHARFEFCLLHPTVGVGVEEPCASALQLR
jgi:hypothetical protein